MERFSPKDIPIERVWSDTNQYSKKLQTLFRKSHSFSSFKKHIPPIIMFDSSNNNDVDADDFDKRFLETYEIFPAQSQDHYYYSLIEAKKMVGVMTEAQYTVAEGFFYDRHGFASDLDYQATIAEETTHSVLYLGRAGYIEVTPDDLRSMRFDITHRLADAVESLSLIRRNIDLSDFVPNVCIDELFAPIGSAYILNGQYEGYIKKSIPWDHPINRSLCIDSSLDEEENYQRAFLVIDAIEHLPEYAGLQLLSQYDWDAEALMKHNPDLAKLNPRVLWEQYIKPALMGEE